MANIYPIYVQSSRELTKAIGRTAIVITDEQLALNIGKRFKTAIDTPSKRTVHSLKAKLNDFQSKYYSLFGIDKIDGLSDYMYIEREAKNYMLLVKCKGNNKIMPDDKICDVRLK